MTEREQVEVSGRRIDGRSEPLAARHIEGVIQGAKIHKRDFISAIKFESSTLIIPRSALRAYNLGVDIAEIRRDRLRQAANELGGPAKLAAKLKKSDSQISQLIGKNPTRNIGRGLAREIEATLELGKWWLDGTAETAPKSVREELIAEMVHELTPEQQGELLKILRSTIDANKVSTKAMGKKIKTIGNARVEETLGLPRAAKEKT